MSPDTPYRLLQGVRPAVLVVRMGCPMLVEYDHGSLLRIFRIMQIPVMAGIPGHDRHIIRIRGYDIEILRIQTLQIIRIKHRQHPSPLPPPRHILLLSQPRTSPSAPSSPSGILPAISWSLLP